MDDSALKEALKRLMSHGDAAENSKLMKMSAIKKAPGAEMCPECKVPLADEKCPQCGYSVPVEDDGDMASMLEHGAQE